MIHDNVTQEIIDTSIAKLLEEHMWKDCFGRNCEEKKSFGHEVSIDIDCPDYFLAADEVGGSTSQKGNGHQGGNFLLCEKGTAPKRATSNQDEHFTLLDLPPLPVSMGRAVQCLLVL